MNWWFVGLYALGWLPATIIFAANLSTHTGNNGSGEWLVAAIGALFWPLFAMFALLVKLFR